MMMPRMTDCSWIVSAVILMVAMMTSSVVSVSSSSLVAVAGCDGRSDKKELQGGSGS